MSGLVGGLTHVLLDGFTHGNQDGLGRSVSARAAHAAALRPRRCAVAGCAARVLDPVPGRASPPPLGTNGRGRASLGLAWRIPPRSGSRAPGSAAAGIHLVPRAMARALVAPSLRPGAPMGLAFERAAYSAIAFLFYGAVIGALSARRRSLIRRRRAPADHAANA